MEAWTPSSWRLKPVTQQPAYPDPEALAAAERELADLPPLVTSWEVERLKAQLADAAGRKRFLLQGGACAESFADCRPDVLTNTLKILLQMSLVLTYGLRRRIIRVGRFAGQYAKPRSADTETRDGVTLPSYRGDLVNGVAFTPEARVPDPHRMLRGYERSALTLNFIRSLVEGGFADLRHPEYWDLDFVKHSSRAAEYQKIVESIGDSLRFMETLAGDELGERSAGWTSSRVTRGFTFPTSRPRPGRSRTGPGGTTSARTFRGSGCGRPIRGERTSSTSAGFAIRSPSRSARR